MSNRTRNPIPIQLELPLDGIVRLPLSQGYIGIIDIEDADLARYKWCAQPDEYGNVYVVRSEYPRDSEGKPKQHQIRLHRVILGRILKRELAPDELVDHKNRQPLDNRRTNLRLATPADNARNGTPEAKCAAGYKGVAYRKDRGYWVATIKVNGKRVYLGSAKTPEAAYEIYKAGALKYHGEFASFE